MLLGSSSGFISKVTLRDQVEIEKMTFAYQYGGWNDIGNEFEFYYRRVCKLWLPRGVLLRFDSRVVSSIAGF